jgi:hypothetical protein
LQRCDKNCAISRIKREIRVLTDIMGYKQGMIVVRADDIKLQLNFKKLLYNTTPQKVHTLQATPLPYILIHSTAGTSASFNGGY